MGIKQTSVITEHELKTWPEYFQEVKNGNKRFEWRSNDRDFKVGDILILKEWKPNEYTPHVGVFTGEEIRVTVTYILTEGFGLPWDKVILSFAATPPQPQQIEGKDREIERLKEALNDKESELRSAVNTIEKWSNKWARKNAELEQLKNSTDPGKVSEEEIGGAK